MSRARLAVAASVLLAALGCDGGQSDAGTTAVDGPTEPPAGLSPAEWGERLFRTRGCVACHTITGARSVGGPLDGLFGRTRRFEDGTETVVDEAYVRESILRPQAKTVEGFPPQMPSYAGQLTDAELEALLAFLRSLH